MDAIPFEGSLHNLDNTNIMFWYPGMKKILLRHQCGN